MLEHFDKVPASLGSCEMTVQIVNLLETRKRKSQQLSINLINTANSLSDPHSGISLLLPRPIEVGLRLSDNVPWKRQVLQGQSQKYLDQAVPSRPEQGSALACPAALERATQ